MSKFKGYRPAHEGEDAGQFGLVFYVISMVAGATGLGAIIHQYFMGGNLSIKDMCGALMCFLWGSVTAIFFFSGERRTGGRENDHDAEVDGDSGGS